MDRIRISNGEKRIEVNDQGEYITLNFNDQSLLPRFFHLKENFEALIRVPKRKYRGLPGNTPTAATPHESGSGI